MNEAEDKSLKLSLVDLADKVTANVKPDAVELTSLRNKFRNAQLQVRELNPSLIEDSVPAFRWMVRDRFQKLGIDKTVIEVITGAD